MRPLRELLPIQLKSNAKITDQLQDVDLSADESGIQHWVDKKKTKLGSIIVLSLSNDQQ